METLDRKARLSGESPRFQPTVITDEDIGWACRVLKLPATAFSGSDGKDPRMEVLKSTATLDIEACPGSGKTTLLVAKLAILSRRWSDPRRGLCVLSHTNVARREIEQRLGNNATGQRLLSYPHFVGTIHSFVIEFLSMPWLRSLGYPVRVIDNDLCEQHRRRLLRLSQFSALARYVTARESNGKVNVVSNWRVASPAFDIRKGESGEPEFNDATKPASRQLCALAKKCVTDGYHRYDEMFMWGHDLLDNLPDVCEVVRKRFPMLFIDEVQDNSEEQSFLLFRLFTKGDNAVFRQRFGDANQAIYQHAGLTSGATTDQFPDSCIRREIPNSHRFSQEIANLANPLALKPQNLIGCGPLRDGITSKTFGKHAIFLFSDSTIRNVIRTYADYLQELFSEQELRKGTFTAVGGVHRPGDDNKLPRFVGQYWQDYDHELTSAEPKPKTFLQYVVAGRKLAELSSETHHLVEKVADGVLRLVRLSNPTAELGNRKRKHRHILDILANKPELRSNYLELLTRLAVKRSAPSTDEWNEKWSAIVTAIAEAIDGAEINSENVKAFLDWRLSDDDDQQPNKACQRDNMFRDPPNDPKVEIHVGSIHSVKGQTHTATLVLDTYFHEHQLASLKPWLLGQKTGRGKEGTRNLSRLKQHYVAMTRPTHLLCLAMREDTFTYEETGELKSLSWRVARVGNTAPEWL